MTTVHLNIGTNLGDREANIRRAFAEISALQGVADARLSSIVESEPWGFESSNRFMNAGVMLHTDIAPLHLLHMLQHIERKMGGGPHRAPDGSYIDRVVDIDMILYGDITMDTPELKLPHPRMYERDFVMRPLRELQAMFSSADS